MALKYLIPPAEGWEQNTYYVAEVAATPNNPIHACILAVGFFESRDSKIPSRFSSYIFNMSHDPEAKEITEFYYIKAIEKINMKIFNSDKCVSNLTNIFELERYNIQKGQQ